MITSFDFLDNNGMFVHVIKLWIMIEIILSNNGRLLVWDIIIAIIEIFNLSRWIRKNVRVCTLTFDMKNTYYPITCHNLRKNWPVKSFILPRIIISKIPFFTICIFKWTAIQKHKYMIKIYSTIHYNNTKRP